MGNVLFKNTLSTPIGDMLSVSDSEYLYFLHFVDYGNLEEELGNIQEMFDAKLEDGGTEIHDKLVVELEEYFQGERISLTIPTMTLGTIFQRKVWNELKKIPFGKTCCYQKLGENIGKTHGMQAIGNANGKNRILLVIPCHRVIQKDGDLGGFSAGVSRKKFLLDLERESCKKIFNQVN